MRERGTGTGTDSEKRMERGREERGRQGHIQGHSQQFAVVLQENDRNGGRELRARAHARTLPCEYCLYY